MDNNLVSRGGLIIKSTELGSNSDKILVIDSSGEVKSITNDYLKMDGSLPMMGDLRVYDINSTSSSRAINISSKTLELYVGGSNFGGVIEGAYQGHLMLDLLNNSSEDVIGFRYSSSNNTVVDTIGLIMKGNGNVGIGTNNPSEKLGVNGNVSADSFKKSGGQNNNILLDGGGIKAVSDFADSINRFYKGNAPDGNIYNSPINIGDGFGAYSVSGSIEGYPYSGNARALIRVAGYDRRYVGELAFHTSTGNMWTRGSSSSEYGEWQEIFHEGNLNPSDYMKLYNGSTSISKDSVLENGITRNTNTDGPYSTHGTLLTVLQDSGKYGFQIIDGNTDGKLAFRTRTSAWGDWNEFWHGGNLTPGDYLKRDGGLSMTGNLDMANQAIVGLNALSFNDVSDNSGESIKFPLTGGGTSNLWIDGGGVFRQDDNEIYHTGNLSLGGSDQLNKSTYESTTPPNSSSIPQGVSYAYRDGMSPDGGWGHAMTMKSSNTRTLQLAFDDYATGSIGYRYGDVSSGSSWDSYRTIWDSSNLRSNSQNDARYLQVNTSGSYDSLRDSNGSSSQWIRTTSNGIIPYTQGGSSVGTPTWPFNEIHGNTIYAEQGQFEGTVTAEDFIGSSDERKKENIEPLPISEVKSTYKTFNFIGKDQPRVGVIAQELEKTHPEFVRTDENGYKSVSYQDLYSAEIAYLKKQNEEMSAQINDLKELVNKLIK